jgi:hypothetical protein
MRMVSYIYFAQLIQNILLLKGENINPLALELNARGTLKVPRI